MEPAPLQQVDRTYVRVGRRRLSYFAGCDYFRLSSHPRVLRAVHEGLEKFGLTVAASRLTTGNHQLYAKLERELSEFFGVSEALIVGNGYSSNLVVAQALYREFSRVLIDQRAHPSLKDAALLLGGEVRTFHHRSAEDLAQNLRGAGEAVVVMTDGLFAQDGTIAPLAEYLKVLPRHGVLWVDDAHGAGVLGLTGKGTPEHCGISRERLIQTVTLSKAFGTYGGAVLGSGALREKIVGNSRMFAGSTALPLPFANAAIAAIQILKREGEFRERLLANIEYTKGTLRHRNIVVPDTPAPIISMVPASAELGDQMKTRLLSEKVFPSFIQYPGGPPAGSYRFVLSSEHTRDQIDGLLRALQK